MALELPAGPDGPWPEGEERGGWRVVFAGHGRIELLDGPPRAVRLRPAVAGAPDVTHAALVVSPPAPDALRLRARLHLDAPLRTGGPPNPWEAPWLVWRYTDPEHFAYLACKPNGWELGVRHPSGRGGQRFLASGDVPRLAPGGALDVEVRQRGAEADVRLGGTPVARVRDDAIAAAGAVGLYAEDADVRFSALRATALDD